MAWSPWVSQGAGKSSPVQNHRWVPSPWRPSFPAQPHCSLASRHATPTLQGQGIHHHLTLACLKHHHQLPQARPAQCQLLHISKHLESLHHPNLFHWNSLTPSTRAHPAQLHYFWGANLLAVMYLSEWVSKVVCLQFPALLAFPLQHPRTSEPCAAALPPAPTNLEMLLLRGSVYIRKN